jgi:hypothetical protein
MNMPAKRDGDARIAGFEAFEKHIEIRGDNERLALGRFGGSHRMDLDNSRKQTLSQIANVPRCRKSDFRG